MTIRRWTILTISTLAALIFLLIFTVNIVIDPYGEFRLIEGSYNKLKFKTLKSSALNVASKLYNGKYTLVFGSSRTMLVSEEILGEPILNFSTSIYNNPGDILALLKTFDEQQLQNIKQIYYLIDINSFHYQNSAPELDSKAALFMESFRNVGPNKIEDAWKCVADNLGPESEKPNFIDEFGVLHKKDESYKNNVVVFSSQFVTTYYLDKLAEINSFCTANKIKINYFTVPWKDSLPKFQQQQLDLIFDRISRRGINFYDFSNKFDLYRKELYSDPTHLNSDGLKYYFQKKYWRRRRNKQLGAISQDFIDFKKISKENFLEIYKKQPKRFNTNLINQIHLLGRDDLVRLYYSSVKNPIKVYTECFMLDEMSLLKVLLYSGKYFSKDQQAINIGLENAIRSGNSQAVKSAILLGANVNNCVGYAPPILSVLDFTKNNEILSLLIACGADINYIDKDKLEYPFWGHSAFTFALTKRSPKQLNFLLNKFHDNPLAKHAALLRELEINPENATAYEKCSELQTQYYSNGTGEGKFMKARFFISNPSQCYLTEKEGNSFLVLPSGEYWISKEEAVIFNNISVKNRCIEILNKSFSALYPHQDFSEDMKAQKAKRIAFLLANMVNTMLAQKVLKSID